MFHREYLHAIFRLNASTQALFAILEEFEFKTYLGPINEQRNAHTHLIRALAAMEGFRETVDEGYIEKNLQGAINHECRAFYDVADWFTIKLREDIITLLKPYSDQVIQTAIPQYYSKYHPRIEEISEEIAGLRLKKDAGDEDHAGNIAAYEETVLELLDIYKTIVSRKPALVDIAYRQSRAVKQNAWRMWRGSLIAAIISFLLTKWWGPLTSSAVAVWEAMAK